MSGERVWSVDQAAVQRYAAAVLMAQTSLLPGLSALEAAAAMAYARNRPMRPDRSFVDDWLALDPPERDAWVERVRRDVERVRL